MLEQQEILQGDVSLYLLNFFATAPPNGEQKNLNASWSSGNAFVSGAGGLRFKSRTVQIGHSVANGSPPLRHFFEWSCVARAQ